MSYMTCLNALMGEIWKSEKSIKNIVLIEELVKNRVMNAKIDLKVVMVLSTNKSPWMEQFTAKQPKFIGIIFG